MDDLLVFSHHRKIKCCTFLTKAEILIADQGYLILFDIGKAKPIAELQYKEQLHPICIWVIDSKHVCLQGKMGHNYVYEYNHYLKSIKPTLKYPTYIHGFCKMVSINNEKLLGVSEELRSICLFNMLDGNIIYNCALEDQKYGQSISCIAFKEHNNTKGKLSVYFGQQGCKIHHIEIDLQEYTEDTILQVIQSLAIEVKQEIKIINCLEIYGQKMYALARKQPFLYILSLQPKLTVQQVINFNFLMPKQIKFLSSNQQNKYRMIVSDKNKLVQVDIKQKKMAQLIQIKQSKSIQNLAKFEDGICGNTQQRQFFHLQL